MAARYEKPFVDPAVSEWSAVHRTLENSTLQSLRSSARRRLLQASESYRKRLLEIGRESNILHSVEPPLTGNPDETPIVMTGHQPVVFHSGLTFKYETTEQFVIDQNAIGVAIVIDTDEGDAGAFSFPVLNAESPVGSMLDVRSASESFATQPSLYRIATKRSQSELAAVSTRVQSSLERCGCAESAALFAERAEMYAAMKTDSMMEANLIVRWSAGVGGRLLEVPLSEVCGFPEVVQFFGEILSRPFEFARCYNETLGTFRHEHNIRNDANPFPDLQQEDDVCELPFWIVNPAAGTRQVVHVRRSGYERTLETKDGFRLELTPDNESAAVLSLLFGSRQLVPRGGLITATLRLLFSDLFVHGTGGGRYDRYTDLLIRTWWNVEPPPFAVASASRYLFDEQRRSVAELQKISEQLRDLQFNPQKHFGRGLFSPATEAQLQNRLVAKETAVAQLQQARANGQSAQETGRTIQQISDEIKATVAAEFEPRLAQLRAISSETIATINVRTWPWFFFPSSR